MTIIIYKLQFGPLIKKRPSIKVKRY